jgi:hypothetical protein
MIKTLIARQIEKRMSDSFRFTVSADSKNLLKRKQSPSGRSKTRRAGLHLSLSIHVVGAELPSVRGQPPQIFFDVDFPAGRQL